MNQGAPLRFLALALVFASRLWTLVSGLPEGIDSDRRTESVSALDAESGLLAHLSLNISEARLAELETALQPTYNALPKVANGHLGHQTVRYVLHRLFVQRYSWYFRGLEPDGVAPAPYMQSEWVPSYLQDLLEQRFGESGLDLRELAALAATMEDLVMKEVAGWLRTVYDLLYLPEAGKIQGEKVEEVIAVYMMIYLRGGNYTGLTSEEVEPEMDYFASQYTAWPEVKDFLRNLEGPHLGEGDNQDGLLDFAAVVRIANEVGQKFGSFNDKECRSLKTSLLEIEDKKAGRVRLASFYRRGLYSHWDFNEKIDYLRALGAIDESNPGRPHVIVPNYVSSRTNCLQSSNLYAVCCRNECEDLLGSLERQIVAPMADAEQVLELVSKLSSDTVFSPRILSDYLRSKILEIAEKNRGQIPLHGRLFAQWMHHAFPRECPYPHESGTTSPVTPDEWMAQTGADTAKSTEEEMRDHIIKDVCPVGGHCLEGPAEDPSPELPWSESEELLDALPLGVLPVHETSASLAGAALMWFLDGDAGTLRWLLPVFRTLRGAPVMFLVLAMTMVSLPICCCLRRRAAANAELPVQFSAKQRSRLMDLRVVLLVAALVLLGKGAGLLHEGLFACALFGTLLVHLWVRFASKRLAFGYPKYKMEHFSV